MPFGEVELEITDGASLAGGGSTPAQSLPTKIIRIASARHSAAQLEQRLRRSPAGISVIARIEDDRWSSTSAPSSRTRTPSCQKPSPPPSAQQASPLHSWSTTKDLLASYNRVAQRCPATCVPHYFEQTRYSGPTIWQPDLYALRLQLMFQRGPDSLTKARKAVRLLQN